MINYPDDELVLGRGRVYFDPFLAGTRTTQGERYVGNTLSFQITRDLVRQERMFSFGGLRIADTGVILEESHKVTFVTESIDLDNLADFFGTKSETSFLATSFVTENMVVYKGRYYQLGKQYNLFGLRHAEVVYMTRNGEVLAETDWESDPSTGRFYIPATSSIPDGATVSVTWENRDQAIRLATSKPVEIWGALRFISDNGEGGQKHVFMPCVRLFSRGAVDLKGDQWQQLPFEADVTNLTPAIAQVHIDIVDMTPGETSDYKWLQANPIPNFEVYEDLLDLSINIEWPETLLGNQPVYIYDTAQGIEDPANAGMSLFGAFDLVVDGTRVYRGLSGPFVRPAIDATTIFAYRSTESVAIDYVLTDTGLRTSAPTNGMVMDDTDIWSVGTDA